MNVADRFRQVREFCGVSQVEMAKRLQVSKNSWQRYEQGELPGGDILNRLGEQGFNVHWLVMGQGEMLFADRSIDQSLDKADIADIDQRIADADRRIADADRRVALADQRTEELKRRLEVEKQKTQEWLEGARNLLAACIIAVDQMAAEQRLTLPPKQRAGAIASMFIELGSRTDEEIHASIAASRADIGKSGTGG
ncbi:helix-turn-helix domain-containing protein [Niveispirillum sp. KHB5.9]|uniref:helix-turn-helix domain-containing protein n=1 Tax=Niveispirillum sp. KHB5.9 TaxID=3400269 RepID=UPI003A8773FC